MTKMTKGSFTTIQHGKRTGVSGYLFDLLLGDGTVKRMGVYENGKLGKWCVVDVATGAMLCDSTTRKDAVARAESEPMVQAFTKVVNGPKYASMLLDKAEPKPVPKAPAKPSSWSGWVVCGTTADGKDGWLSTSTLKTDKGAKERLQRAAHGFDGTVLASARAEFADGAEERDAKLKSAKATLQKLCDKVVTWDDGHGMVEAWTRKEEPVNEVEKAPEPPRDAIKAVLAEVERLRKRVAELEAEKAEPKDSPEPEPEAAEAISLATMQAWCGERGLYAEQKRPERKDCIWVHGVRKDDESTQAELNGMGFRWSSGRKAWYFDPKRA